MGFAMSDVLPPTRFLVVVRPGMGMTVRGFVVTAVFGAPVPAACFNPLACGSVSAHISYGCAR
jgi:hypothetical protein